MSKATSEPTKSATPAAPEVASDGSTQAFRTPVLGGMNIGWNTILTTVPIYLGLVVIWIYFDSQTAGKFIGARNLSEMVQEFSYKSVLALGMVFVLLLGEIDLSLGFLTLLSVTITADFAQNHHMGAGLAIGSAIAICCILGMIQGFFVAWVRMPAFVVTLGGFLIFEGVSYHILGGATINVFDPFIASLGTSFLSNALGFILAAVAVAAYVVDQLFQRRSRARSGLQNPPVSRFVASAVGIAILIGGIVALMNSYRGVPVPLIVLAVASTVLWYFSRRTRFGRHIYAVGGNMEAARRAGINTTAVRWIVFGLAGIMAGIAGVMLVGQSQAASTTSAGPDLLLDVISIAVIGGVSLTGGKGSAWGVLLGGLVIASIDSGLNLMNTDPNYVYVIKGGILVTAILIDVVGKRRGALTLRR
ncbi:MAG: sugar ABC transporter permease [Chloroflexota bacterium]